MKATEATIKESTLIESPSEFTANKQQNKSWRIYKRLLAYVKPMWFMFALAILGNIGFASVEAGMISLMQPLLDEGFIANNKDVFKMLPFALIAIVVGRGAMSFMATYCMAYVGRKVVMNMRQQLFSHMLHLPTTYFDHNTSGQLLSRVTYNTSQVASASTDALKTVVKEGASVIFLLGLMLYHSWQITLLFIGIAPVIYLIIRYVSKRFRKISKRIQESMGNITHTAEESLEGYKVVKIFGGQHRQISEFNDITNKNRQQEMKMVATKAISSPVVQFLVVAVLALTVHLASLDSLESTISAGSFVTLLVAMMALLRPVKKLTDINDTIQKGIAAAESIFEVLDEDSEKDEGTHCFDRADGNIEYRKISFTYSGTRGAVLRDINVDIKAGQTVALVGRSGSGKTSFVSLLPRFYDNYEGDILIDGISVRDVNLSSLRNQIALVSQHITLFNDTIYNNIAYGRLNAHTSDDIYQAAKVAHVLDFTDEMPDGLNTLIGENGVTLSGGQRQRIAIARAILKNAPILILDEATSALDTESEKLIQEALDELIKTRTTLVIAHRLSTIENADKIIVMDRGRVIESGSHQALMDQNGLYAKLHKMQFKGLDIQSD